MAGVKLYHQYLICDPAQRPVMETAAELGVPVLMHAGKCTDPATSAAQPRLSSAEHFLKALKMFPDTMLIQGHIGGGGDWEWNLRELEKISGDNYFIDISGSVIDAGIVRKTVAAVGANRVLFATDMSLEEGVGKVMDAGLSTAILRKIFSGNMKRIFARRNFNAV
jgi:predicted TIM-barrel fold metal-dependent hydrolase